MPIPTYVVNKTFQTKRWIITSLFSLKFGDGSMWSSIILHRHGKSPKKNLKFYIFNFSFFTCDFYFIQQLVTKHSN